MNIKKTISLALSSVMAFSMMAIGGATTAVAASPTGLQENATYQIINKQHAGYALNIHGIGGNFSDGTNVNLYSKVDTTDTHMHWRIIDQGSGKYRLASAAVYAGTTGRTKFVLDRYTLNPVNNADIYTATQGDNANQQVSITQVTPGVYKISLSNEMMLTAAGTATGGGANGATSANGNVYWSSTDYGNRQLWSFSMVSASYNLGTYWSASTAMGTRMAAFSANQSQPVGSTSTGYWSSANPFPPQLNSANGNHWCTWYAWGRMYERLGKSLVVSGDAKTWANTIKFVNRATYSPKNSGPKVGVAVFGATSSSPYQEGHVVFVEGFDNTNIYFSEANGSRGTDGQLKVKTRSEFDTLYGYSLLGYIS